MYPGSAPDSNLGYVHVTSFAWIDDGGPDPDYDSGSDCSVVDDFDHVTSTWIDGDLWIVTGTYGCDPCGLNPDVDPQPPAALFSDSDC